MGSGSNLPSLGRTLSFRWRGIIGLIINNDNLVKYIRNVLLLRNKYSTSTLSNLKANEVANWTMIFHLEILLASRDDASHTECRERHHL